MRGRWWWAVLLDQVANRLVGTAVFSLEFDVFDRFEDVFGDSDGFPLPLRVARRSSSLS